MILCNYSVTAQLLACILFTCVLAGIMPACVSSQPCSLAVVWFDASDIDRCTVDRQL